MTRIDLSANRPPAVRRAIGDGVQRALVDAIGIPAGDRFQIITPHDPDDLVFDAEYPGVHREDIVYIQIIFVGGRPRELKLDLHRRIAANLAEVGVRPEDVFVVLHENGLEDWSVGNGEAQLVAQGTVPGIQART
ncbi:tautomerase family protein [Actinoallomurus acaciae]|uniref:Tautomerase family protein n=1 Tax=Actinoallomurus acaciae TaxID=502577 RepID=A0ABV5YK44_9ACTN